jgi:toxin-antitoxin system, toxin component, hipA family
MGQLIGVGYEGLTISEYIQVLRDLQVSTLVDVRLNATSRKPGFSKTRLKGYLADAGIPYLHYRELGNPKDNRKGFWDDPSTGSHVQSVNHFKNLILCDDYKVSLLKNLKNMSQCENVALLCYEKAPEKCHRTVLIELIREM